MDRHVNTLVQHLQQIDGYFVQAVANTPACKKKTLPCRQLLNMFVHLVGVIRIGKNEEGQEVVLEVNYVQRDLIHIPTYSNSVIQWTMGE